MVRAIYVSEESGVEMQARSQIELIEGLGVKGDRYATGKGHYSGVKEWDAHLTLIAEEPFVLLRQERNIVLDPKELRRNILVKGVDLEQLVDRKFKIGESVLCRGRKLWPPCSHIVKHTQRQEIFQYMAKDCGLGVDVLTSGTIKLGDQIEVI